MAEDGADAAGGDAAKAAEDKVKEAAEGLKKILDVIAPDPKEPEAPKSPAAVIDELYGAISAADITDFASQASAAVERYRNSMRWLVGAVAAIGLALFGSTAFTDGDPFSTWQGWVGLGLASLGLVLILHAATLVFEPEDASLGELAADIKRAREKLTKNFSPGPPPTYERRPLKALLSPRVAATLRLSDILEGREATSHLGNPHLTVRQLIASIGTNQSTDRAEAARKLAEHRRKIAANDTKRAHVDATLTSLLATRSSLDKTKSDFGSELDAPINSLISASTTLRAEAATLADGLVALQTTLEATDHQLGLDLLHRSLVLSESGVAQLRGTFRLSRRFLLAGAILTLFGAMLFIAGLKSAADDGNDDDAVVFRAGTLTVQAGTPTADEFAGKCVTAPADVESNPITMSVVYFGEETPALSDSFEIEVTTPEDCAGEYEIPADRSEDDATLLLLPPVEVPSD